jgi:DNA-binding GntR family transcriptional regulator
VARAGTARLPVSPLGDGASLADQAYYAIRTLIVTLDLPPGSNISEPELVERLGIGRTPVREALRRLAAEGLVDLVPRQGARVSRVSLQTVRDLFDFRALLEPVAIRQATEATAADPALRRSFTAMRTEFARIQKRTPSQARARDFYALADRFDWAVIDATRNEHLRRTIAELRPHTARLRNLSHVDPARVDVSVAEHLVIVDALLRGDADEAAARTADHLAGSIETIFRNLGRAPGADLDLLG